MKTHTQTKLRPTKKYKWTKYRHRVNPAGKGHETMVMEMVNEP